MDYLNYGKRVQQQPQKSEPQGFGQQKVQLTKDDFRFGDLKEQTTQPLTEYWGKEITNDPTQKSGPQGFGQQKDQNEVMNLFMTPLFICPCPFEYGRELEWIKKQSMKEEENEVWGLRYNRQSKDSFILDKPEMSRVRQFIEFKLKEFTSKVMGSDDEMVITQSWLNRNRKGASHHEHKHPNSMFSGVWYPQINESSAPIQFKRGEQRDVGFHIKEYNMFNSQTFLLPMKMGELILFPSNLMHSVPPNRSDEERISLSFNTWPTGDLGDKKSLTYLPCVETWIKNKPQLSY